MRRRAKNAAHQFLTVRKHWQEATDKPAAKERQMREEIEAQRAEIAKLNRQLAEG